MARATPPSSPDEADNGLDGFLHLYMLDQLSMIDEQAISHTFTLERRQRVQQDLTGVYKTLRTTYGAEEIQHWAPFFANVNGRYLLAVGYTGADYDRAAVIIIHLRTFAGKGIAEEQSRRSGQMMRA